MTSSETTDGVPDGVPTDDEIAAAEALAGRPATLAEHRALMRPSLVEMRNWLRVLRTSALTDGSEPAVRFALRDTPFADGTKAIAQPALADVPIAAIANEDGSLAFATAADLARLLRAGRVTSRRLTELYLERLKRLGPVLHCVVNLVPDEAALAAADRADAEIAAGRWRGPLHGIPYGAKDLFATAGLPTTCGAAPYEQRLRGEDAVVLQRLEAAGAILVAKLSMGELAMGDVWFGGMTRNPWQPETGSSGSSAGSASAVAAGLVGFALGTETWGSIVSPSVVCGVTGLRPTFGRVPRTGADALAWSMDKIGPMARGVEDCALVLAAIAGPDAGDGCSAAAGAGLAWDAADGSGNLEGLRIGIDRRSLDALDADEAQRVLRPLYDQALAVVERLAGRAPLLEVDLPEPCPDYEALPMLIIGVEGAAAFAGLIADGGLDRLAQQEEGSWPNIFRVAATVPATEYVQAQRVRTHLQHAFAVRVADVDVYATIPRLGPSLAYTNLTGHPEIVVRCGRTEEGMPVSLSFVGQPYREDQLLRVAYAFERATPWHRHWPRSLAATGPTETSRGME